MRRYQVPGQYSGLSRPDPTRNVMITGFHPSLLVMSSLRKPKRLKIRGTDEKEHLFLVKVRTCRFLHRQLLFELNEHLSICVCFAVCARPQGGEDLRSD